MCIYQIKHKISGKCYIGQTTGKIKARWKSHCSNKIKNSNAISLAIKKYSKDAFELSILEVCDTIDQLNEREIHWIKELNTLSPNGYNLQEGGKNGKASLETRLKISKGNIGKVMSEESRLKLSQSKLGKPGHKHTEETKKRLSEVRLNKRPIMTEENLLKKETHRLVCIKSRNKIATIGASPRCHSEETRLKISKSHLSKRSPDLSEDKINKLELRRLKSKKEIL